MPTNVGNEFVVRAANASPRIPGAPALVTLDSAYACDRSVAGSMATKGVSV
jgi:hypothetical protein